MTTYRLPDALGGGEYEATKDLPGATMVWFKVPGGTLEIQREFLVPVGAPPTPPEPPNGSVVTCDEGYVHIRQGASWTDHDDLYASWARLCYSHDRPLTRLVPDPFAQPVELPWGTDTESFHVAVSPLEGRVRVYAPDVPLDTTPGRAREVARALWAAADAVEAKR